MAKKRKRAPGGGRKPKPNKKLPFSTRLEPHILAALKAGAQTWPSQNVSEFAEHLIDRGLREREEAKRDPALRALLFVIANLADRFSGLMLVSKTGGRPKQPTRWRTDLFYFKAFKFAIQRLLDILEEPPKNQIADKIRLKEAAAKLEKSSGPPDWKQRFIKIYESPERFGKLELSKLLHAATRADAFNEWERFSPEVRRVIQREWYGLSKAFRDLELKQLSPNDEESI
jgi:hypothetical protein